MTKQHQNWFTLPKTPKPSRSSAPRAQARQGAPVCACGCGQRILPASEEYQDQFFSRECLERWLGIAVRA